MHPFCKQLMLVCNTIEELRTALAPVRQDHSGIGLVPTMGALHSGHLQLVRKAMLENPCVVVSIFVNPTQFNDPSDLEKYPRPLENDLKALEKVGDDLIVFVPDVDQLYGDGLLTKEYDFDGLDLKMEGEFRPGHFQGVATIVEKLLRIVEPHRAYFGEKDYQQLQIIRNLVAQEKLAVHIIGCDIIREESGLAMSSRNERLSKRLRKEAAFIYKVLKSAKTQFGTKSAPWVTDWVEQEFRAHPDLELEYFVIADSKTLDPIEKKQEGKKYRAFIAVYAEGIRLIDNVALN